jgi:hypothetical protein
MKNLNEPIKKGIRDRQACSAVLHPTEPPSTHHSLNEALFNKHSFRHLNEKFLMNYRFVSRQENSYPFMANRSLIQFLNTKRILRAVESTVTSGQSDLWLTAR